MIDEKEYHNILNERFVLKEKNNKKSVKVQLRKVLKIFRHHVGVQSRILDAGCNEGIGIQILRKWGYTNVEGIEYLLDLVSKAKEAGLKVSQGDLHNINIEEGVFDAVFTRYTLEHCHTPSQVMTELVKVLKPNGILFIVDALDPCGQTKQSFSTFQTIDDFVKIIPENVVVESLTITDTNMGWQDFICISRKVKI